MRILRLHVENFGTLKDFSLEFEQGMNVLYRENGWGKSTLAVFIKAMLYGLPASSKRSLDENERKKYVPWQGGAYGGSLEFETAKGCFRAERFFGAKESGDRFSLFDLATNLPSQVYSQSLGEELFGIDADGFERSTYLSQRSLTGGKDNNSISAKLGNLLDDVGDIGSYDTAIAALDKRRRYYVMTGNRGAIAEMEEARLSFVTELEHCRRVEEAMRLQEQELAACTAQLTAARMTVAETRERMKRAALFGERAALIGQKNNMLSELSALSAERARIDAFLGDPLPSPEELSEQRTRLEKLQQSRTRLESIPTEPRDAEQLHRLRQTYRTGMPNAADLERVTRDNEQMRELRVRYETLRESVTQGTSDERFAKGVPSTEALASAKESLLRARSLQKTAGEVVPPTRVSNRQLPFATLTLGLGILLGILSFLPMFSALSIVLLSIGCLAVVGGGVWSVVSVSVCAKKRRQAEERANKRARLLEEARRAEQSAVALLREYRMPVDDPAQSLAELSVMATRYREYAQKRHAVRKELEQIKQRHAQISERIRAYLSHFVGECAVKDDYRAQIERLTRESDLLVRLETEEMKRISDRRREQAIFDGLNAICRAFSERYDPDGRMPPADCLSHVGTQLHERERLCREIAQKEQALKAFIAEKKLDETDVNEEVASPEALAEEERMLQARITDLQRRQATLKGSVERLSQDVDRIPELEGEIAQLKLRIDEAKANAATVTHTAAFLEEAKNALSTRYLDGMQESFREFLALLCEGEAPEAVMDTSFEVRLRESGQTRSMESFSRGWRDVVEFCTRLSLTDALYAEGEKPFLLLDDPFVNLDDRRLAAARQMLARVAEKYQILYTVCHKDRA